ncbi:hypothetical protein D7Y56_00340 (plasmid) [Streptomyces sp. S501]|uniref:hypothetical protein n=1 Tax=Streptomyces sp. S501 TaxID=2420135 RepID=UPI00106E4D88|nr:hypothetical protein [Streptomyces sp. S501]QBR04541.1 hypothetical protein D7Y56_00340 [Streptomyces sp. S501]
MKSTCEQLAFVLFSRGGEIDPAGEMDMGRWKCIRRGSEYRGRIVEVAVSEDSAHLKVELAGNTPPPARRMTATLDATYGDNAMVIKTITAQPEGEGLGTLLVHLGAKAASVSRNITQVRVDLAAMEPGAVGLYRRIGLRPDSAELRRTTAVPPWSDKGIDERFSQAVWQEKLMDSLLWNLGDGRTALSRALADGYASDSDLSAREQQVVINVRNATQTPGLQEWVDPSASTAFDVERFAWAYRAAIMTAPLAGSISQALERSRQAVASAWQTVG